MKFSEYILKEADPIKDREARLEGQRIWRKLIKKMQKEFDQTLKKLLLNYDSKKDGYQYKHPANSNISSLDVLIPSLDRKEKMFPQQENSTYLLDVGKYLNEPKYNELFFGIAEYNVVGPASGFIPKEEKKGINDTILMFVYDLKKQPRWDKLEMLWNPSPKDEQTFLHEFIHYLDSKRQKDDSFRIDGTYKDSKYIHYNNPKELNAYTQDIMHSVENYYKTAHEKYLMDTRKKISDAKNDPSLMEKVGSDIRKFTIFLNKKIDKPQESFLEVWKTVKSTKGIFFHFLTDKNTKKVKARLYQFYTDVLVPQFKDTINLLQDINKN